MDIKTDIINSQNSAIVQTADETETSGKKRGLPGVLSVFASFGGSYGVYKVYKKTVRDQIAQKYNNMLSEYSGFHNVFSTAGHSAFRTSGLEEKGVTLFSSVPQMEELGRSEYPLFSMNSNKKRMWNNIREAIRGDRAFYDKKNKRIFVNAEKRAGSMFHEMGHAKNFNSLGIGRLLTIFRPAALLVPAILAVAAIRKPKEEGEESETLLGKGLDYVKRNCVALSALAVSPMLLEEGLASLKGIKMAKGLLPKGALKDMIKMNGVSWLSYVCFLGAAVLGVHVADKVRNITARTD